MLLFKKYLSKIMILVVAVSVVPIILSGCSKTSIPEQAEVTNPNPNKLNPIGTIQGKLVDKLTLEPISGAIIDIGVSKTTTTETGQFVLSNVPATRDAAKSTVTGSYSITIDLRDVNKKITAANAALPVGSTPKPKYPEFAYNNISVQFTSLKESETLSVASSQHDTPVDRLIANKDLSVGKLHGNLEGLVAGCDSSGFTDQFYTPVGSGYIVKLMTSSSTDTTGSGASGHLIGQTTTDADGKYSFSNVEAGLDVIVEAVSADGTKKGSHYYAIPGDGQTLNVTDIQKSTVVHVCSLDVHGPEITSVSPEVGSDQTPGSIDVVLTFSEAVKQTAKTSTDVSSVGNLYENIEVMFDGNKANNVAYSLAWNSTFDKLTVTIPKTETSSLYHVRLKDIDTVFADAAGNSASLGKCPDDSDSAIPSAYGITVDGGSNDCTVYFTTKGGTTVGTPSITLVNESSLDEDAHTSAILDWAPVSGAKKYNVYCTKYQVWGTTRQADNTTLIDTVNSSEATHNFSTFVENDNTELEYDCLVRAVNSDGIEGADSNTKTIEDKVGPKMSDASGVTTLDDTKQFITDVTVGFNEPLDAATAGKATNYTFKTRSGTTAPGVSIAYYNSAAKTVRLTLDNKTTPFYYFSPVSIKTGAKGIAETVKKVGSDDVQKIASGKGEANSIIITAGADGILQSVASGDDIAKAAGSAECGGTGSTGCIISGPDGIANTAKATGSDDVQVIPVGEGKPNAVVITAGPDAWLQSTPNGDVVSGKTIVAGPDGDCDTTALSTSDDIQILPNGTTGLHPFDVCINAGPDGTLDTTVGANDEFSDFTGVAVGAGVTDVAGNPIRDSGNEYRVTTGLVE